jgi:hypothetical protein
MENNHQSFVRLHEKYKNNYWRNQNNKKWKIKTYKREKERLFNLIEIIFRE